jgi:small subunit ribosomal protein S18
MNERTPRAQGSKQKPYYKRKTCKFCEDKNLPIDYKSPHILRDFITERGKMLPRRITGTCSNHQKKLAIEIKRARIMALLPFTVHD